MSPRTDHSPRWRRYWDRQAPSCDRVMRRADRLLFGDSREWVCSRGRGEILEVAIGTGLNLPLHPRESRITGVEWSGEMLRRTRDRADELGRPVELVQADARALPFPDASFDTVLCTFSLCAIPDEPVAVAEMHRVLRPGGSLLLADHITSSNLPVRLLQRLADPITTALGGEKFLHRPLPHVRAAGFEVELRERFRLGIVERITARKPA
ncbi:class I SAM-dependent methyltransferase [Saccharopolyspora sp. HNM0983]|uniref:Class I SAM-dependent methyltransferase n=1 Tax=Saccharopolyspora montiporae TaxID=2781240 RepID=A0A929BCT4_9PSEU|nr:class I SAM-dependent methyltransferase [Saccharopolyspora sp. HNM0983]MBE9376410.1 class I SAM-dependent methyltransferase [Saccharopolyspora sp. HNM0983]